MAFSITDGQLAILVRAASDADNVPSQIALTIKYITEVAKELIVQYAPGAPAAQQGGMVDGVRGLSAVFPGSGFPKARRLLPQKNPNPVRTRALEFNFLRLRFDD